jgi:DNA-binding NarL/FixJ family response regulator
MTCHKFTPVFADGRIRYGICLITCSAKEKAGENSNKGTGNLRLYYKDNDRYDEYSFERHKWDAHKIEYPTKIEKIVLIMSMSGESGRSIAVKLCMSYDKLRHILTGLYEKLGVRTMRQALIHSMNHSLLFRHSDNDDVPKPENRKLKKNKQQWNRLTSEVSQRIQACSDKGQSIRSIAKEVGISEGAIRKAIKNNRLTKE